MKIADFIHPLCHNETQTPEPRFLTNILPVFRSLHPPIYANMATAPKTMAATWAEPVITAAEFPVAVDEVAEDAALPVPVVEAPEVVVTVPVEVVELPVEVVSWVTAVPEEEEVSVDVLDDSTEADEVLEEAELADDVELGEWVAVGPVYPARVEVALEATPVTLNCSDCA